MKNPVRKKSKKWRCTVCGAVGKKWQSSWRANRSGRQHINNFHEGNGRLLIINKKEFFKKLIETEIKSKKSEPTF
jgi:hypothetical protein